MKIDGHGALLSFRQRAEEVNTYHSTGQLFITQGGVLIGVAPTESTSAAKSR